MKPRNLQIILATTVFAALLWAFVSLGDSYQMILSIPVELSPLPPGLALSTPVPRNLELSVRGEGWILASLLWRREPGYRLDVGSFQSHQRIATVRDVERQLNLPAAVEVIDMKPESLHVGLDVSVTKNVIVQFDSPLSFAEGYGLAGPPLVNPETVLVAGAASILMSIDNWRINDMPFEKLTTPVEKEILLNDDSRYALTFTPGTVSLRLNVEPFAEKPLANIPVEVRSVPPNREVILIPPRIEIVVRGGISLLAALEPGNCKAHVDYAEAERDSVTTLLPVVELPKGLTLISRRPERLEYVIRRRL